MATGLPVVTNKLPNLEDYSDDSGVLFSAMGDVDSMVKQCSALLTNKDVYWETSEKIRKHALQFDFEKVRARLFYSYRSILNIEITH